MLALLPRLSSWLPSIVSETPGSTEMLSCEAYDIAAAARDSTPHSPRRSARANSPTARVGGIG